MTRKNLVLLTLVVIALSMTTSYTVLVLFPGAVAYPLVLGISTLVGAVGYWIFSRW